MSRAITKTKPSLFDKYSSEISNQIALVYTAAKGISISVFDSLLALTRLQKNELASFIDATPKTIDNYRAKQSKLGRLESEQLLQILSLYKKGREIFGSIESFNGWLKQSSIGLGGEKPFDLMYTPGGINLIMEELIRIEFGALA